MRHITSLVTGILAAATALIIQLGALLLFANFSEEEFIPTISITHILSFTLFLPIAAFIEEACKYVMIAARAKFFPTRRTIALHAIFVGVGFALVECALIIFNNDALALSFSIGSILLLHVVTSALMGVLITVMRARVLLAFLSIILLSALIHTLYNMTLLFSPVVASSFALFLLSAFIFLLLFAFLRDKELAQPQKMSYNEDV